MALSTPLLLAVLARRSCSRIVSSLVASLLPCCPASFPASAFLLAVLARRSCSPFLLAVLARRSCSPVLLAVLAAAGSSSSELEELATGFPPPHVCQARQLRHVSRIDPSPALLVTRVVSSLVASVLPCCPASSPASFPSSQSCRSPSFCVQRHSRGTAATAFAVVAAAGPHSCTVLLRPAARRRTSGLMTFEDPMPHAIRMSPLCFGFLVFPGSRSSP